MRLARPVGVAVACLVAACGPARDPGPAAEVPGAEILAPADGDSVSLPVTIRLGAVGVTIAPASGVREEGIGHHHLLLDVDLPAEGMPIPAGGGHVHLGTGASEWVLDSMPAGTYRIIAAIAWGDHVPIAGARTDTIRVVVR